MANTELEKFGEMLIDARNAGVREVFGWCFGGERPINPTKELKRILRFVDSLSKKQKRQLVSLVAYFIDASLFSFITRLENGEYVYNFQLFMRNEEAGEVLEIVGDNVDNDLLHRYWEWESRYGAIEE